MKTNLPCEVVRDLLPMYADKLTEPGSTEAIEAHLAECSACRALYREMTKDEPQTCAEPEEIDYLKKVRRSKKRLLLGIAAAVLVLAIGAAVFLSLRAAKPLVNYDEETDTLIVYGKGGYDALSLPEVVNGAKNLDVQDDSFHLAAYLPAFQIEKRTGQTAQEFLPGFLDRTDKSLAFLRSYLKQNAPDCYPTENAEKFVNIEVYRNGDYAYDAKGDRITLKIGNFYWHRDDMYLLALMDPERVEWQQIGYTSYLADCVEPYPERGTGDAENAEKQPYYEAFLKLGGKLDGTPEDNLRSVHAAAYVCLRDGLGYWGTTYESRPVTEYGLYSGPIGGKPINGNDMSPAMATSFIAWLTERYGFAEVSAFCFGQKGFSEAFGTTYKEANDAWRTWLTELCEQ